MAKNKNYEDIGPWSVSQERFGKAFIKKIGKWQTRVYELTNGKLWNTFLGVPCAILSTTGAKTGLKRKTPLLFLRQGDSVVMVASQGGFSTLPYWYKNLKNNPKATIQIQSSKLDYVARDANESEKTELWPLLDDLYEGYKEYRARTRGVRDIPIVIFELDK